MMSLLIGSLPMKTPRIHDLDPQAPVPNLGSPMDNLPAIQKPPRQETSSSLPERANLPTLERPNGRRIITRNSFEIYEDQMQSLRRLSYEEKMDGKLGSMSAMVREAIDTFIQQKPTKK